VKGEEEIALLEAVCNAVLAAQMQEAELVVTQGKAPS